MRSDLRAHTVVARSRVASGEKYTVSAHRRPFPPQAVDRRLRRISLLEFVLTRTDRQTNSFSRSHLPRDNGAVRGELQRLKLLSMRSRGESITESTFSGSWLSLQFLIALSSESQCHAALPRAPSRQWPPNAPPWLKGDGAALRVSKCDSACPLQVDRARPPVP